MINYFSQVIRSQRVKKSLVLVNIIGLSVCIATALLIILYVWSELSYDSFHNAGRVYRVESRLYEGETLTDNWATTAYGHAPTMVREIAGIEKYVRVTAQDREQVVNYFDRRFAEEHYCYTEPAFFEIYNPQIQISAESETKRSIFREKDKTKRSKKESAQHSKSRNKSFVMTSVSAL